MDIHQLELVIMPLVVGALTLVFIIDLKTQIIPDTLNAFIAICGVASLMLSPSTLHLFTAILGALLGSGFFLLIAVITKGAIGGGDIKLMFGLGLLFGPAGVLNITLLSFALAALASIGLLLTKRKGMKDFIPLGPAIVIAAFIQIFAGSFLLPFLGI